MSQEGSVSMLLANMGIYLDDHTTMRHCSEFQLVCDLIPRKDGGNSVIAVCVVGYISSGGKVTYTSDRYPLLVLPTSPDM